MTAGQFATYAVSKGCQILQSGNAEVIRIVNPNYAGAKFNVFPSQGELTPYLIKIGCTRLYIPIP